MKIFLVVKVLDVNYNPHKAASATALFAGTDPGSGSFDMTPTGDKGVFEIEIPPAIDTINVDIEEPGFFPIHQRLQVVRTGAAPSLKFGGAGQEINIRNIGGNSRGGDFAVEVYAVLGQLRDCRPIIDSLAARFAPGTGSQFIAFVDPVANPVIDFTGLTLLDRGPKGWNAMIHKPLASVTPQGSMFYIERTDTPKLIAAYVPAGLFFKPQKGFDPNSKPLDFHLFYHPSPSKLRGSYPFSFAFLDLICRYLLYFPFLHKEMTNQHEASGKKPIFLFPVGNPAGWMGSFGSQSSILRLLQEVSYYLQRRFGIPYPLQPIRKCIVSGFSAGGMYVRQALGGDNAHFHNQVLHEIYGFDLRQESPGSFAGLLGKWWNKGADGRCFRLYTTDSSRWDAFKGLDSGAMFNQGVGGGTEMAGPQSTVAFVPVEGFWQLVNPEHPPSNLYQTFRPVFDDVHQIIPAIFMEHALKNSTL